MRGSHRFVFPVQFFLQLLCLSSLRSSVAFSTPTCQLQAENDRTMSGSARPLRCIVTGASSGIGAAICTALGHQGHRIFLSGRNAENLAQVAQSVQSEGGASAYGIGDVTKEQDVKRLYKEAMNFLGGSAPDLLVASAGIGRPGLIEELSEADFDATFATNVKGVWLWAREAVPAMKEQRSGQVILISSLLGLRTSARQTAYGASKWAVQGIAGSLREECRGTGVKIATICPGAVATPWWMEAARGGRPQPASAEQLAGMLTAEDVAAAAMTVVNQARTSDIERVVLEPPPS